MKYLNLPLFVLFILTSCEKNNQIVLTQNQGSDYQIVVSQSADSLTHIAAKELQYYIFKVSDTQIEIAYEENANYKSILIGKALIKNPETIARIDSLKEDGFIIQTNDSGITISGNDGKSNLYAAYTFIEEFLGCRLLTATEEYI